MKEDKYFDIEKRTEIRETARKLRRQFLRYQEAELVYSMTHRKFTYMSYMLTLPQESEPVFLFH